ncbi:MAG: winged helix-turn-helix domain-containing protein [Anaerolineae bacterium]|nr:winged helix-turn-helix domain-containing protein [Anaerolineae bacterium]
MLKRVLQELSTGNVRSQADLAQRLGISEGLLMQMMEELMHKGYLMPVMPTPACGGCSGCGVGKTCPTKTLDKLPASRKWILTAKGYHAAGVER